MKINVNMLYDFIIYSIIFTIIYKHDPTLPIFPNLSFLTIALPLASLLINGLYPNLKTFSIGIVITLLSIIYFWPALSTAAEITGILVFLEIIGLFIFGLIPFVVELILAYALYLSPPPSSTYAVDNIPIILIFILFTAYIRGIALSRKGKLFFEIKIRVRNSPTSKHKPKSSMIRGLIKSSSSSQKSQYKKVLITGLPTQNIKVQVDSYLVDLPIGQEVSIKAQQLIFCPQEINGITYVPNIHITTSDKVRVTYSIGNPSPSNFRKCYIRFRINNYNSDWLLNVDGVVYKLQGNDTYFPLFDKMMINWKASPLGNFKFNPSGGQAFRGDYIVIDTLPTLQPVTFSQATPQQWNANLWVGKNLYGYKIVDFIGEGGNGYVLKGESGGTYYALKILKLEQTIGGTRTQASLSSFDVLFSEGENLKKLSQNPRFVEIYGIYVDRNNIKRILDGDSSIYLQFPPAIVMEFMEGGNLESLIQDRFVYSQYWYDIVKEIIKEVAEGLAYLHSSGYVHLDIKPANIFFSSKLGNSPYEVYQNVKGKVKIGDLGSAVKVGSQVTQITPAYASPDQLEALITGKGASPSMDIFSLGVTLYKMLTMSYSPIGDLLDQAFTLYANGDIQGALNLINQAKSQLPIIPPSNIPREFQETIIRATDPNPLKRITAKDILAILQ
ncbi:hypothetical protein SJAV_20030 [Sulfurisphaera javensis]|uniref:Protein kinase domain-containing protein n=1 Tax=Sulfurisphaera javensis TaxID=2049879 RepID=A0AAT9GT50_9CREN